MNWNFLTIKDAHWVNAEDKLPETGRKVYLMINGSMMISYLREDGAWDSGVLTYREMHWLINLKPAAKKNKPVIMWAYVGEV